MVQARGEFHFSLNGQAVSVQDLPAQTTLLDYIRSQQLTGAKEGCAEGECGACAVLLVAQGIHGTTYRPVNSCLMPLPAAAHQEIYTVEGLADSGKLAEVQQAMVRHGGSQCGYCTPGFVVSMFAEQYGSPHGRRDVHALGGNLCRCTGYRPIQAAFESLGPPPDDQFSQRLKRPVPAIPAMRYRTRSGEYSRPTMLAECVAIGAEDPSARYVAGNTDLGVLTNLRGDRFPHLVGLDAIAELREFQDHADAVDIGAALTLTEISERWTEAPAVIRDWLDLFASPLIRNRATLGGNLATASPIGDSAPLLLALDAELRIASHAGERVVPLSSFFRGYRQTALQPGELIRSVRIPKPFPQLIRFFKIAKRRLDDISTVAAGISMNRDETGTARHVRIGLGGVAATPVRAVEAEREIEGTAFSERAAERAAEALRRSLAPIDDHRGSAAYRLAVAANLIAKFRYETLS